MVNKVAIPQIEKEDLELIRHKTSDEIWSNFQNQSIFITGGTGFIGCWLVEALVYVNQVLGLNISITLLSRNPERFQNEIPHLGYAPEISLIKGDVTNLTAISGRYDTIIHAATDVTHPKDDQLAVFNDIKTGTDQVLALARRSNTSRFLLTSSGAIYGRQPPEQLQFNESFLGSPELNSANSAYGLAKRYSEWAVNLEHQRTGLDTNIARCFTFVGPYMPLEAHFAIGNFIEDCISKRNIHIAGDGTPYRSYLYAADLIIWLFTILIKGDNSPYNIGSDNAISILNLAKKIQTTLDSKSQIIIQKKTTPNQLPERYIPSIERAAILGLKEYTSLDNAIIKTTNWNLKRREFTTG